MASIWGELKRRNVVRVAVAYTIVAWLLLQVADVVLNNIEAPAWVFQTILLLLIIGFPVALIFAWAFELTPEGIKKESNVDHAGSVTRPSGRQLDFVIIGLMALAILFLVVQNYVLEEPDMSSADEFTDRSIAVLPFQALSSGADDGYFADGLTEEILNSLAQVPELEVKARTSSFYFKGKNIPVSEIAERLDVAHVVEGTVRRDGNRLRITAQLIHASDDKHLWSKTYDRTLHDVFAVQQDIAENIAETLDVVLDEDARQLMQSIGIRDVDAFIAFQKGREAFGAAHNDIRAVSELLHSANAHFDRALEIEPGLIAARVMKIDLTSHVIFEIAAGFREERYAGEAQEVLESLREQYGLAMQQLRPGNQRDVLDLERAMFSNDWIGIDALIDRALQPGGCPQMNWIPEFVGPHGWAADMAEKHREKLECDPVLNDDDSTLPWLLIWSGETEVALHTVEKTQEAGSNDPWVEDVRYWAMLANGRVNDPSMNGPAPSGSMMRFDRQILRKALAGDLETSRSMAEDYWSRPDADYFYSLYLAAVVGDLTRANEIAAQVDAYPGGFLVLQGVINSCICGAPFDLDATPVLKSRIEEAGFPWPPATRIDYPAKTW